ncbi:MAG: STAS/SEC14 domain-containing protein [Gallionella sp.]
MDIYNSKYLHIAFFAEQRLIEATWLSESKMMNTEECKQEFLNYLDVVRKQGSMRMLVDTSDMYFTFGLEMQDWINQTIFTQFLNMGINKVAIVISKDFFAQLSTNQAMNEKEALKHTREYFDHKEAAKKWLLSAT